MMLGILTVVLSFVLKISSIEWAFVIFSIGMVLGAETFNSAVEALTDLVQPGHDPRAGLVKDLAAGAVLITAIAAGAVGLVIFIPKIIALL